MTTLQLSPPMRTATADRVGPAAVGRTLLGYLLLPRPKDLVKAVIVPLAFVIGVAARGSASAGEVGRAVLVWLVLELLVYQARYQWNDVRGFEADQAHPDAASRGRLPGPVERARPHITASLSVVALRLGATAGVAVAFPQLRGLLLLMTVGVFGVAFVYEHVRALATGRTTQMPVPLHRSLIGLWIAVGAGYAVRGMTGLALAVPVIGRPSLAIAGIVTMWTLGIVFVTCRWALEAMCFASFQGGRVVWDAEASKAREHTLGLVRWLPSYVHDEEVVAAASEPAQWRALASRTSLVAPWHLALLVAGASAALTGRLLVGGVGLTVAVAVAIGGAAAALVVTGLTHSRAGAGVVMCVLVAIAEAARGLDRPVVAVLPLLVVLLAYACFTQQCAAEIGRPLRRLEPLLRG